MKIYCTILCLLSSNFLIFSQNPVTTQIFLRSALDSLESKIELVDTAYKSGWISTVELRTETDEFLLNNQQYQLRFSPVSLKERKKRKDVIEGLQEEIKQNKRFRLDKQLLYRYTDWIKIFKNQLLITTYQKLQAIIEDKNYVISNSLNTANRKYSDIIKNERQLYENKLTLNPLKTEIEILKERNNLSSQILSFDDCPKVDQIQNILDSISSFKNRILYNEELKLK